MQRMFSPLTPVLVFAALLALATAAAVAQPPAPRPPRGPGFGPGGPEIFLDRMAEELELSESQAAEIEELIDAHKIDTAGLRAEAEAAHGDVRELVESDLFDEAAIRAAAGKAAELHVQLTVERARLRSAIHGVLTPEQKERAAELKAERPERHRGRPGFGRGRAPRARG